MLGSIRYYNCGFCTNQLAFAYKGHKPERRQFPSGVFLIKHQTQGYTLFDTGYSREIYQCGLAGTLYGALNPTVVTAKDEIEAQLLEDGIDPSEIKYVILSHLHPDHIGGVKFFPNATFIVSKETSELIGQHSYRDIVFDQLLPPWLESRLRVLSHDDLRGNRKSLLQGYDLFGDGSLFITTLEGHTHGQIGAYIPGKLLLAADACWGEDLLEYSREMRVMARFINADIRAFGDTIEQLIEVRDQGIRLCFSHDTYPESELLP